jgi:hypothetical protein
MGMTVRQESVDGLLSFLDKLEVGVGDAIVDVFAEMGEYVVEGIRNGDMSNWNNQTGSLRSSVGFAVCKYGEIVRMSDFKTVLDGSKGSEKGRALCERLASEYANYRYVLVIVAGEDYAAYVEAIESKVVLVGGQLYIEKNIAGMLAERIAQVLGKK